MANNSYYTVVVDCGSTGTRVNVYHWKIKDGNLPNLLNSYPTNSSFGKGGCEYHCMQTKPGLDKFVSNFSGVRASLEPLIVWAEQWVPRERHRDTPIFVLATAGMRMLLVEDARRVLEDVEVVLKEHEFRCNKSWIRVLSGKEEAYYGWVALNYQMGIFGNSSRLPTLGLLDLGGSSLQVVAEIDKSSEDEHVLRSRVDSVEHEILAYSLPAFGLNEAFGRTVVMLSHKQELRESSGGTFEVIHPCFSSGFVQNFTCHGCFGLNSTDSRSLSNHMRENEVNSIFLVGEPNWDQCKALVRAAAINLSSSDWSQLPTDDSKCPGNNIINLTAITHSVTRFHALSGFFAVYNILNLRPRANLTKIWEKGQQLCSRSWTNSGNQNYAGQYCFRVPYLASLIEDALCLGDREIIFGPGDVSWTLGAALIEGKYLWLSTIKSRSGILSLGSTWAISSPLFLFVLLLLLLFIVYHSQIKLPMPGRKALAAGASLPSYVYPKRRPL